MAEESEAIKNYLASYFDDTVQSSASPALGDDEQQIVCDIVQYVEQRFDGMKYILGLALDFTLLAQRLSAYDMSFLHTQRDLTLESIFDRFSLVERVGARTSNTLTFKVQDGSRHGIRKIEEELVDFFHGMRRSAYPSAYVYNTGQWRKFEDLLLLCFQLGEVARHHAAKKLIEFGLEKLTENSFWTRDEPRSRVFSELIADGGYERSFTGQNGGLILQAIFYGYFKADRPHLDFVIDKVRTGSSRQKRFGDIDGYYGADLELTSEVKDLQITSSNLARQCGAFMKSCQSYGILGIIACESATNEAYTEIERNGCAVLSLAEVRKQVAIWDWPKQDVAFCSCLHYVSHVEQDADATIRLLEFARSVDPNHSMQEYLRA